MARVGELYPALTVKKPHEGLIKLKPVDLKLKNQARLLARESVLSKIRKLERELKRISDPIVRNSWHSRILELQCQLRSM
jgi:hypothetical protein